MIYGLSVRCEMWGSINNYIASSLSLPRAMRRKKNIFISCPLSHICHLKKRHITYLCIFNPLILLHFYDLLAFGLGLGVWNVFWRIEIFWLALWTARRGVPLTPLLFWVIFQLNRALKVSLKYINWQALLNHMFNIPPLHWGKHFKIGGAKY